MDTELTIKGNTKDNTQPLKGFIDFKALLFALFIMAGSYKGDPRLAQFPIDLTLLMALLTVIMVILVVLQKGFSFAENALPGIVWLYILFAIPLLWTEASDYSSIKVTRLFTLTLLASVAPMVLFRTREDIRRLLDILALLGLFMAADAVIPILSGSRVETRLTGFGSNTIALGRAAGLSMVWIGFNVFEKRLHFLLGLVSLGFLNIAMVGAGSRGPLTATLVVIILFGILFYVRNGDTGSSIRFFGFIAAACFTYVIATALAPEASLTRLLAFFHGGTDTSRLALFQIALQRIPLSPLGIGWGGYASLTHSSPYPFIAYPHNIILELSLEAGWFIGLYFVILLIISLYRSLSSATSLEQKAVAAVIVFCGINAMVSGDINDNRLLLAFITMGLMKL